MTKRTEKNSVFLDLSQNKSYLLKLYKTLPAKNKFDINTCECYIYKNMCRYKIHVHKWRPL